MKPTGDIYYKFFDIGHPGAKDRWVPGKYYRLLPPSILISECGIVRSISPNLDINILPEGVFVKVISEQWNGVQSIDFNDDEDPFQVTLSYRYYTFRRYDYPLQLVKPYSLVGAYIVNNLDVKVPIDVIRSTIKFNDITHRLTLHSMCTENKPVRKSLLETHSRFNEESKMVPTINKDPHMVADMESDDTNGIDMLLKYGGMATRGDVSVGTSTEKYLTPARVADINNQLDTANKRSGILLTPTTDVSSRYFNSIAANNYRVYHPYMFPNDLLTTEEMCRFIPRGLMVVYRCIYDETDNCQPNHNYVVNLKEPYIKGKHYSEEVAGWKGLYRETVGTEHRLFVRIVIDVSQIHDIETLTKYDIVFSYVGIDEDRNLSYKPITFSDFSEVKTPHGLSICVGHKVISELSYIPLIYDNQQLSVRLSRWGNPAPSNVLTSTNIAKWINEVSNPHKRNLGGTPKDRDSSRPPKSEIGLTIHTEDDCCSTDDEYEKQRKINVLLETEAADFFGSLYAYQCMLNAPEPLHRNNGGDMIFNNLTGDFDYFPSQMGRLPKHHL